MKLLNKDKKIIIGVIIGIIISIISSFCLAETLIESKNVSYIDNSKVGATNVQNAIDGTCTKFSNELTNLKKEIINEIYPIGSIYISTTLKTATEVQEKFGGTWTSYGVGKTLLSSTTSEQTGGSNTVTLTTANLPAHTHNYDKPNANTGSHTLTVAEMPAHSHTQNPHSHISSAYFMSYNAWNEITVTGSYIYNWNDTILANKDNTSRKGHIALMRIGSTLETTATNQNTGGGGGHTHPISTTSTATSSAGSANPTAINVQNPYITVYMYKRTK